MSVSKTAHTAVTGIQGKNAPMSNDSVAPCMTWWLPSLSEVVGDFGTRTSLSASMCSLLVGDGVGGSIFGVDFIDSIA